MVGLGRMGANLVRRLMRDGHTCVVFDTNQDAVKELEAEGAIGATSMADLVAKMERPRNVWIMVPAAIVQKMVDELKDILEDDDTLIDGGNSYYRDDIKHAKELAAKGIHFVDCGTSGGVWGLERGYSLMIGGEDKAVQRLDPIWKTIAPGEGSAEPTPGRKAGGTAQEGYLHCGPNGAGHFVKMVHNGIEYGMMAAIAEGLSIIKHADAGKQTQEIDAETTPLRDPEYYQYEIDVAEVAEVWRRGSVVGSWLVDLTASALAKDPNLDAFDGRVSDSGEGRWTTIAAIEEGVPAPVITASLIERFESRGLGQFSGKVQSAMRSEFGGHDEKKA
jgi:6-phosphogluconate dehydrogenase